MGDKNTFEANAAWQALYDTMASIFIQQEKELYEKLGSEVDKGFVPFTVVKKEHVASGPTYLVTLARQDGGKVWSYNAGQYITLRIEEGGVIHNGHYTLLDPPGSNIYSVALKLGNSADQNIITTEEITRNRHVNSTVLVSAPAGTFGLVNVAKNHLFIAVGIGIASLLAMISALNQQGKAPSTSVIQCVRSEEYAAFAGKLHNIIPRSQYSILTERDPISE